MKYDYFNRDLQVGFDYSMNAVFQRVLQGIFNDDLPWEWLLAIYLSKK